MDQPGLSIMLRVRGSSVDKAFGLCPPRTVKNQAYPGHAVLAHARARPSHKLHESLDTYNKSLWLVSNAIKASRTSLLKLKLVDKRGCIPSVLALLFCGHQRHPNPPIHGYSSSWTTFKIGTESYRDGEGGRTWIAPSAHQLSGYS